jgi:hypothetical protein
MQFGFFIGIWDLMQFSLVAANGQMISRDAIRKPQIGHPPQRVSQTSCLAGFLPAIYAAKLYL